MTAVSDHLATEIMIRAGAAPKNVSSALETTATPATEIGDLVSKITPVMIIPVMIIPVMIIPDPRDHRRE